LGVRRPWFALAAPLTAARIRRTRADIHQGRGADLQQSCVGAIGRHVRADVADDVRGRAPWARSIKQRVVAGSMPPWGADTPHGVFKTIRASRRRRSNDAGWVDAGAPEGDDRTCPATPKFADGWTIGTPDAVFEMDEEFTIPRRTIRTSTQGADRSDRDKWIQAMRFIPRARRSPRDCVTQPAGSVPKPGGESGRQSAA